MVKRGDINFTTSHLVAMSCTLRGYDTDLNPKYKIEQIF